jgi:23S rRNA (uracil1939-C5)-methyltransferase
MRSEAQIPLKQGVLIEALRRIGRVEPEEILPPLSAETPWGYRRKARLGVKYVAKKGKVLVGFRERGSSFVTDLTRCDVLHPRVGELITPLGQVIGDLSVRDRIPQIEMSMGDEICVLVFRVLDPLSAEDERKLELFGRDHRIVIYLQEAGPESVRPLSGDPIELTYRLPEFGVLCRFSPNDFTQVNMELNRLMVHRALQLLDPQPEEEILELFCGLGNFTLPLARRAAQVTGVEGDAGLVARARANARANGMGNTRFYTANLYADLDLEPWLQGTFHKILLDPPRTGAQEVMQYLPRVQARRILYVSCNPATLARDADELVNNLGYRLAAAGIIDMFPHTAHVESIALFEKRG